MLVNTGTYHTYWHVPHSFYACALLGKRNSPLYCVVLLNFIYLFIYFHLSVLILFLGHLFFNIYVSDLSDHLLDSAPCYQYADDTTVYKHCSVKGISQSVSDLNSSLNTLNGWSTTSNLAPNSEKLILCWYQPVKWPESTIATSKNLI